jgi:putative copper export protein/mono/diheme cytochrome c family protein
VDWPEICAFLVRGAHLAALLSLFGCLVFRRFVIPREASAVAGAFSSVVAIETASTWIALLAGAVWLVLVSGTMGGAATVLDAFQVVAPVVRHTGFGHVICARIILLACVAVLLRLNAKPSRTNLAALLLSGLAIALQPLLGHIGALPDSTRLVLIPVEIAHLLAAAAWLGGLLPLLLCVMRAPLPLAATVCERFTPVGLVAVGTLAVTALPQAGELIGGLGGLFGTTYGMLALFKLGFFMLALGLAGNNGLLLTARLHAASAARDARRWLVASIAIESAAVLCVVFAAAAMASSAPAAHTQPVWPFAWRPSTEAWEEPELRPELLRLMIAVAIGLAMIAGSQAWRRFRIAAVLLALLIAAPFTPALSLLLVEAYPTSYTRSTTGFSVDAIEHGKTLFGQRCAMCHDPQSGTGSGADLLAPHVWGHLDGELFWSIADGVTDAEDNALMPAFGSVLPDDDLWALIDFIRARNIGVQVDKTGQWSPPVPAPAMPLQCTGPDAGSLADLDGHVLEIIAGDGPATSFKVPGLVRIRLMRDPGTAPPGLMQGECISATPSAWAAWSVIAGTSPEQFAGYEAIVDPQGWMRAWFPPGADPARVLAAVNDARGHPIAGAARTQPGHHH